MNKKEEEVKKTLDEMLYRIQMSAYYKGINTGYNAGIEKSDIKEDTKRSILTEEEEAGAAKMGQIGFNPEQIRYRIQYLRKKDIETAIRSILNNKG